MTTTDTYGDKTDGRTTNGRRTIPAGTTMLNRQAFTPEIIGRYGCTNLTQFAHFLGVHRTTLMRAYTREADPGSKLMTALLAKTMLPFAFLFTVSEAEVTVSLPRETGYDPGDWPPGGPYGIGI